MCWTKTIDNLYIYTLHGGGKYGQARSQGGGVRAVRRTTPNLPKGPLFPQSGLKNGFYEGGLDPKGPLFVTKAVG